MGQFIVVRQRFGLGHNYDDDELCFHSAEVFSDLDKAVEAAKAYRATGDGVAAVVPSEGIIVDYPRRRELHKLVTGK